MFQQVRSSARHRAIVQASRKKNTIPTAVMRKMDCPVSTRFDKKHLFLCGPACKFRHTMYSWEGAGDNRVGLLADSICKWIRNVPHLNVQSVPGLHLSTALQKIREGAFKIQNFEALILSIGSNDLSKSPMKILNEMRALVTCLRTLVPDTKLGICLIIPRPSDPKRRADENRRKTNALIKAMCKRQGIVFLDSYKGVCTNKRFDLSLYANDFTHLNWRGINRMRTYMRGAAATMLEKITLPRPIPRPAHPRAVRPKRY
jgi:hypothetical protein